MADRENQIGAAPAGDETAHLTDRQAREIEYHRDRAARYTHIVEQPVSMDIAEQSAPSPLERLLVAL